MSPTISPSPALPTRPILFPLALCLVGLGLRLFGLAFQPLWWDEGFSVYFATESLPRLLELTALDIHPPLYYILLKGWYQLVGVGALQARWLSVLLGVLAIPLAWRIARDLFGRRAAAITALLLTVSPFHIYYSQEVRMYALMVVLALAAALAWRRRQWEALGLAVLAGLLTQYYFALLAGAIGLGVLLEVRRKWYGWRGPLRALLIAIVGYLPWVLYALPRLITYVGGKLVVEADQPMTPLEFFPRHFAAWSMGHLSAPMAAWGWAALAFVAAALYGAAAARRSKSSPLWVVAGLWLIPTLGIFVVGWFAPFADARIERQLLFVLPFFLMLAALGLARLWQERRAAGAVAVATLVALNLAALADFYLTPRYPGEDYRPLLAEMAARESAGDGWLAIYEWQAGYLRAYVPDVQSDVAIVPLEWADDDNALRAGAEGLLQQYARLWLPAYQVKGRIFEEQLAQTLAQEGVVAWDDWYGNTRLYLFAPAQADALEAVAVGSYPGMGELRGEIARTPAPSGVGVIPVVLTLDGADEATRVSLQLTGRGSVWGEWDGAFENGAVRAGIPVAPGTPPGEYQVEAMVYGAETGIPLQRMAAGQIVPPEASLGSVTVQRPTTALSGERLRRMATIGEGARLGGSVEWLGAALPQRDYLQGDVLPVTLFWQAAGAESRDLRVFIQGFDSAGELRIHHEQAPVNGTYPLPQWEAGDLVRDPHRVQLPADLPAGSYRLVAGLYDPASGERLRAEDGQDTVALGEIRVEARERLSSEPEIGTPVEHRFGEQVTLRRVEIQGNAAAGEAVAVVLVWQSERTGGSALRVFVQLYQGETQVYSSDHEFTPPATAWIPGEYIVDRHQIPAQAAGGNYRLVLGVYEAESGAPLLSAEGAQVLLEAWK